jgi:hypothetical protein
MRDITPAEAARARVALAETDQLLQIDERATVTVETWEAGDWVAVFEDVDCEYEETPDQRRRSDGLQATVQVRTDALPSPTPIVSTAMRATITIGAVVKGPFQILQWAAEGALGETYRAELRLTPAPRYD